MKVPTLLAKLLGKVEQVDAAQIENFNALAAEFVAYKDEAEGVVQAYTTQVAELTTNLEAAAAQITELQSQLDAATAEKREAAEAAAAAKVAARKEKIVAAIGEDKADALLTATAHMEDAQFDTVVAALTGAALAEAKSPLFKEVGASVEANVPQTTGESAEMKILKQKYQQGAGSR